jgi:putative transposase
MLAKKVRLIVPKEYHSKFLQFCGAARYGYNWALNEDLKLDLKGKEGELRKEFTQFKKLKGNEWMKEINNDVFKQSIKDYFKAKSNYFNKLSNKSVKKKKYKCRESFYIDVLKIKIMEDGTVYIPSIGYFKYSGYDLPVYYGKVINKETTYIGIRPMNPRVTYDGINFYLSLSYEENIEKLEAIKDRSIGVDLGLKTFATICINDNENDIIFKKVNSLKEQFKKLNKQKKRLDRKISKRNLEFKEKGEVTKSNNYSKLLKKRLKYTQKITNIQKDLIYKTISDMVKSKPERIVIEDLNVKGMMKNKKLAKWISFNQFYEFKRILEYKCELYGIELIIADRFYPSSKLCSFCGTKKDRLSLSERIYKCNCGHIMDRDENAALNLSRL